MKFLSKSTPTAVFAAALLAASGLALAGPPFLTDDPEPVDYQHHELYIATQQTKTADGRAGTLPQVEFNYGVAPDVQLHAIVPFAFNSPSDVPRQHGLGDIELGIKYRFIQETGTMPMVGIFPIVLTQTGNADKGLGTGATQVFLPVWAGIGVAVIEIEPVRARR